MFILGMLCVFIGISLLAPDDTRSNETKDNNTSSLDSVVTSGMGTEEDRLIPTSYEDGHSKDTRVVAKGVYMKAADLLAKTKVPIS